MKFVKNVVFQINTWVYLFLAFPLLDYVLRNYSPISVAAPLWNNGILLLLTLIVLFKMMESDRKIPSIKVPLLAFVLLGVAHIVIDLPNWKVNIEGFRAVFQYTLAFFIGFYLVSNLKNAISFIKTITIVGIFAAIVGIAQVIIGVETPASWADASERGLVRAFSFVVSPNVLGSYMALISPIAFGLIFLGKNKWEKLFWGFGTILSLGALVLSSSRGAWLALFGSILIIFLLINRKLLILFVVGGAGAVAGIGPIRSRLLNLFSPTYFEKSSNDGRIARWMNAFHEMRFDPFFGKGIGHYGGAVASRHFGTIYTDSYVFKTLAEMGLIGLALFLWLVIDTMRHLYNVWRMWRGTKEYYLLGGMIIGVLAVLFHNGVENIFEVPFMNTYFWYIAGLVSAFPYFRKGELLDHEQITE